MAGSSQRALVKAEVRMELEMGSEPGFGENALACKVLPRMLGQVQPWTSLASLGWVRKFCGFRVY